MKTIPLEDVKGVFKFPTFDELWIKGESYSDGYKYYCYVFPECEHTEEFHGSAQVIPMRITNFTATPKD